MLRRNWVLIFALGVAILVAIWIGWQTWPQQATLSQFSYGNPRNEQYTPGGSECQPSALASIRDRGERARKADACQAAAEDYRQKTDDLIQQTRAASAAEAQAFIANQTLWMGWFQTLGGFITLCAAVAAAVYARDAAGESRRTADEAERSRMSYVEGERGHLKMMSAAFQERGPNLTIFLNLKNVGRGMAEIYCVACAVSDNNIWSGDDDSLVDGYQVKIAADEMGTAKYGIAIPRTPCLIVGYVGYRTLTLPACKAYFCITLKERFDTRLGDPRFFGENITTVWMPDDT